MANVLGIVDSVFGAIGKVTGGLRQMIHNFLPDYAGIILLVLAIAGGYYINKQYPTIVQKYGVVWFSLVLFLLLRFV